ncbi:SusD/RagB family nutrient-binding outer membrane lipoprotein [Marinilabilia salmonicolor]|uniref:SusD/RagB family nutrient-binding outer membrane lipoprotein n=1 Tax=Marinilabilia salmonicolor TaxID=989 RepID=UPI000A789CDB|nr:SusD/RagB family nutrient-binding outer membrane lipoprotein [Marinilabilia salmonicolor]
MIFTPVLDSQESLYQEIFGMLNSGLENLNKETNFSGLGSQDFFYGGDIDLWKKFGNGLKARYTMRLSNRNAAYGDVISFADASFESAAEQCQYEYVDASPFYQFLQDRNYFGASQSMHDKLADRNDPRDNVFFTGDVFAPNGTPDQVQDQYSKSAISVETAPTYLLSYHELQFLKAEAYVRLDELENAKDALEEGIIAAFQKPNIGLTAADAEDYFANEVESRFDSNPLAEVMVQKYLAFYEEEAVEAYNDYRRLVAMGDDVITLENPANLQQFPVRFSYGADDVTTNANVREAYGDGSYVYSEEVWWAGGSR